jgi:hypothetical protein
MRQVLTKLFRRPESKYRHIEIVSGLKKVVEFRRAIAWPLCGELALCGPTPGGQ